MAQPPTLEMIRSTRIEPVLLLRHQACRQQGSSERPPASVDAGRPVGYRIDLEVLQDQRADTIHKNTLRLFAVTHHFDLDIDCRHRPPVTVPSFIFQRLAKCPLGTEHVLYQKFIILRTDPCIQTIMQELSDAELHPYAGGTLANSRSSLTPHAIPRPGISLYACSRRSGQMLPGADRVQAQFRRVVVLLLRFNGQEMGVKECLNVCYVSLASPW